MQMLPWGCHIWHLPEYNTKGFYEMGTHQLAGSSPARGGILRRMPGAPVAAPWRCLWEGGLSWLHVIGYVFYFLVLLFL